MTTTPDQILQVAFSLVKAGVTTSKEALFRSSVSRAYYAVFHQAKVFADSKQLQADPVRMPKPCGSHEELILRFQHSKNASFRNYGDELHALKILRKKADYKLSVPINKKTVDNVLLRADYLLHQL